ncbi:hypothetical protein LY76DRAFT_216868 [Colletotrichum caudatum]|nr:hypothetical protein LY76DRAFT_216868 [Colletotrichum caudatum]
MSEKRYTSMTKADFAPLGRFGRYRTVPETRTPGCPFVTIRRHSRFLFFYFFILEVAPMLASGPGRLARMERINGEESPYGPVRSRVSTSHQPRFVNVSGRLRQELFSDWKEYATSEASAPRPSTAQSVAVVWQTIRCCWLQLHCGAVLPSWPT